MSAPQFGDYLKLSELATEENLRWLRRQMRSSQNVFLYTSPAYEHVAPGKWTTLPSGSHALLLKHYDQVLRTIQFPMDDETLSLWEEHGVPGEHDAYRWAGIVSIRRCVSVLGPQWDTWQILRREAEYDYPLLPTEKEKADYENYKMRFEGAMAEFLRANETLWTMMRENPYLLL